MSAFSFEKAAIVGATGPTGAALAAALGAHGIRVRVISRSQANLDRCYSDSPAERVTADVVQGGEALRSAIEGCDLVFDCIGLPSELMHLHPVAAGKLVSAVRETRARCVKVASFWSYLPLQRLPLDESHPRSGGPPWVQWRREAEDILADAGAAVVNLPDFYGPGVHTSVLQQPLAEAVGAKTMNWIGAVDTPKEFVFVPDAMEAVARLATFEKAYGEHWVVPGAGSITGQQVATLAGRALGREVRIRGAGTLMLRVVSLFNRELRGFMPMVPEYVKPVSYNGAKIEALLGETRVTAYEQGIWQTLQWLQARQAQR